jgi:WD repeat-containing protein mio
MTFQTRCNNNIAIDHADPNYFASSTLDYQLPTVMVWDRRASSRHSVSKMYLDSVEAGEVPFGCVLKLNNVVEPRNQTSIRTLRYCRDHRGLLAVLSTAGELQVLWTEREYVEPYSENDVENSPELLEVRRAYPLQWPYWDEVLGCPHDERVVSSDWATLGSADVVPRLVTRRGNSKMDVMLLPPTTQHAAFDLTNFSGKAKRELLQTTQVLVRTADIIKDGEYTTLPRFTDPEEAESILGPIVSLAAQRDAVFSSSTNDIQSADSAAMLGVSGEFHSDSNMRDWMAKSIKWIAKEVLAPDPLTNLRDLSITEKKILSSRERHEKSHYVLLKGFISANTAYAILNSLMLQRCRKRYLFDCAVNRDILADDPWLQDVWLWIEGL